MSDWTGSYFKFYEGVTLCKISIFCRLAGMIYLAIIAWGSTAAGLTYGAPGPIIGPAPPVSQPPPGASDLKRQQIEKLHERREKDENTRIEREQTAQLEKIQEERDEEILKPRVFYGFSELNFYVTKAVVTNGRSNYTVDPGFQFSSYVRSFWWRGPHEIQPWYGLRLAPFSGFGTQDGTTARFAHTWIGPAFGIGKIHSTESNLGTSDHKDLFLVSLGIAGITRLSLPTDAKGTVPEDFRPTKLSKDPPGLWLEGRWTRVNLGALGFGLTGGIQTGTGKIFSYIGASVSGFY